MNFKISFGLMVGTVTVLTLMPDMLSAVQQGTAAGNFGATTEIYSLGDKIQGWGFGPVLRVVGIGSCCLGVWRTFMASSIAPLLTWAGTGLGVGVLPSLIDSIFTMILP